MGLSCQGASGTNENCSIQEKPIVGLTSNDAVFDKDNFDGLPNKLNELKVLVNSEENKPKVIAITEVKHKNQQNLLNSELKIESCGLYSNDLSGNG